MQVLLTRQPYNTDLVVYAGTVKAKTKIEALQMFAEKFSYKIFQFHQIKSKGKKRIAISTPDGWVMASCER